jgi:peptidoglycan/xylan/chitin deacetylase (PgdA/CDA1 family)
MMKDWAEHPLRGPVSRRGLLLAGLITGVGALAAAPDGRTTAGPVPRQATGRPIGTTAPLRITATGATARSERGQALSAPPDPDEVKANELGVLPVMMYHRIHPRLVGEYDMTPSDFRAQLQTLFAMGMRPVRTIDLVRRDFRIKAGYTPVVLTFDDGYPEQFTVDAGGRVDPHSGIGILIDVCRQFPDCTPAGSLYINKNPFGLSTPQEQRRGLARLHELGMEIGNHTFEHDDLSKLDPGRVQEDFVRLQRLVESAVPGASVVTAALPFGILPRHRRLSHHGSWRGEAYTNDGILLVGANPCPSPFARTFDAMAIPRIRGTSWHRGKDALTGGYWISYMKARRNELYVAAGNPGHITAPRTAARLVAPVYRQRLLTY